MKSFLGALFLGFNRYERPLEQAAYVCSSALVRHYHKRLKGGESADPSLDEQVRPLGRKRWAVSFLVICGLVFGVHSVPDWTKWRESDVRGPVNMTEFAEDSRPVTRPLSHIVWNVRGSMSTASAPALERQGLAFVSGHTSPLSQQWLADLTLPDATGEAAAPRTNPALWAFMEPGEVFSALPDLDPERLAPFSVANGEVLDEDGAPLRWNSERQVCEVTPAAQSELMARLEAWERQQSAYSKALQGRAERYRTAVNTWSRRYKLNPDLLYAIIYTESSFNPNLISQRDAHGLMQVVPRTAGGEVKAWLGEKGTPSSAELLDPATNIKYGAAYFRLLLQRHFPDVEDETSREYCAIAAYNAGSGSVLRVFGKTREEAFETINALDSHEVLQTLLTRAPSRETRGFMKKIMAVRTHFVAMNS